MASISNPPKNSATIIITSAPPRWWCRLAEISLVILFYLRNRELLNTTYPIKGWQAGQGFPVHPDRKRLAHHQLVGHGTPETAVVTVITVIAHDKVMPLRDHPLALTGAAHAPHGQVDIMFCRAQLLTPAFHRGQPGN